jgi:hypothetical protein
MTTLVNKIYTHASNNGFVGVQTDITDIVSDALNLDVIDGVKIIHNYIKANGYTLEHQAFEDKYFNWIGTRPKGR